VPVLYLLPELFGLISRILCLWPIWVVVLRFASPYGNTPFFCYSILLLCGMLPAFLGRFTRMGQSRSVRMVISCAAAVAGALLCRGQIGNTAGVMLSVITALYGNSAAQKESDALFDGHSFVGYLTLETLSLILLEVVELPVSMAWALGVTAYQSVVFLVLANRYHLLRLVNRRSDGTLPIPAEIRKHNSRLLMGIILGCVCVFLLRKPVIVLLNGMLDGVLFLLGLLGKALVSLIHLMGGSAPAQPSDSPSDTPPAPMPYGEGNPWWSLLYLLLIPLILLAWHGVFRGWFSDFLEALRQKMGRHSSRSRTEQHTTTGEYEDVETICEVSERETADALRSWKKAYRHWKKLPDTEEKLCSGYGLLLTAPAWNEERPLASDTPLEILQKGRATLPADTCEALSVLTEDYQITRYGNTPMPPRTIGELELLLQKAAARPVSHGKRTGS